MGVRRFGSPNTRARNPARHELAEVERLFLRAPEQRKINPPGEGYNSQIRRLPAFDNRLDNSGRQSAKQNQPPHRSAINPFPPREFANGPNPARQKVQLLTDAGVSDPETKVYVSDIPIRR